MEDKDNKSRKKDMDWNEGPWSPDEDDMLLILFEKHGPMSQISKYMPGKSELSCMSRWLSLQRSFTLEEDQMLQNLAREHGHNWSLISKYRAGRWIAVQFGRMYNGFKNRWDSTLKGKSSLMTNQDIAIGAQNGNLSHVVEGISSHQPPTIDDMARDDMSSQVTYDYSRDGSAPTWNDLNERDSSVVTDNEVRWTMIESDNVQEWDEINWNNYIWKDDTKKFVL